MLIPRMAARCSWLAITTVMLIGCRHGASGPPLREVRVALILDGITFQPIRLAQSRYAAEEGIAIKISELAGGGSKAMEALLGNSVDVSVGMVPDALQVAAQGRDVRCFMILDSRPTMALVIAPSMVGKIRSIADLKGRRVGVGSPGSTGHQFLNFVLASKGLSPTDVSVVQVGISNGAIAALEHNKVDAAVLVSAGLSMFEIRYPKSTILVDTRNEEQTRQLFGDSSFPWATLIAREDWLRSDPETARRFVRAVKKAMQWTKTHSAEQVRETIPDPMRMPDADADLKSIRLFQQIMTPDGLSPGNTEVVLKFLAASDPRVRDAHLDLSKVFTNEFVAARQQ